MSSKSNIKFKDRSRKKRDGTPDKSTTPSQEQDDTSTPSKHFIWNEEIEKLQIKSEELRKVWPPQPPTTEKKFVQVSVQKKKKEAKGEKSKFQVLNIAKPAPSNVPVLPLKFSDYAGPHFNESGEVIPYSLLGTFEDFNKEANQRGKLHKNIPDPHEFLHGAYTPAAKCEQKKRQNCLENSESNALRSWYLRMVERKKQQRNISKLLQKSPEDLVMNQADNSYAAQKQKYLIDRTIPKVDYGKGYRIGSEFWHQQEQLGDDKTGLHMSLTQTQRGFPPPIEHVGLSQFVKAEKGCEWLKNDTIYSYYHWHKTEFLDQRLHQLQPFINEIDPWKPDFNFMQVIGSNRPHQNIFKGVKNEKETSNADSFEKESARKSNQEDTVEDECKNMQEIPMSDGNIEESTLGPSILFGGKAARWIGDSEQTNLEFGIETIVDFEAFACDCVTSYLELTNDGSTSIYYQWKKISKENSFGLEQNIAQRFYFNNISCVILPGDTLKIPFVFKSSIAGVFSEQWRIETTPILCNGAALLVTLRGVALQRDTFKLQREELEKELLHKQAQQIASFLLYETLSGIRTPAPCQSPVDAYNTENDIFSRNNPGLKYNHEVVSQLKVIYGKLFDVDIQAENVWSLSVDDLQESILLLNEDEEDKKEMLLNQMNSLVGMITYIPHLPLKQNLQHFGYQILLESVDRIVGQSLLIRHFLGLPDSELESNSKEIATGLFNQITKDQGHDDPNTGKSSESKKGARVTDGKNKVDSGKERSKTAARDSKTTKPGKPDSKSTSASSSRKTPISNRSSSSTPASGSTPGDKTFVYNAGSRLTSPDPCYGGSTQEVEVATAEKLYKEIFILQVYDILGDMADRMDSLFSSLQKAC